MQGDTSLLCAVKLVKRKDTVLKIRTGWSFLAVRGYIRETLIPAAKNLWSVKPVRMLSLLFLNSLRIKFICCKTRKMFYACSLNSNISYKPIRTPRIEAYETLVYGDTNTSYAVIRMTREMFWSTA